MANAFLISCCNPSVSEFLFERTDRQDVKHSSDILMSKILQSQSSFIVSPVAFHLFSVVVYRLHKHNSFVDITSMVTEMLFIFLYLFNSLCWPAGGWVIVPR